MAEDGRRSAVSVDAHEVAPCATSPSALARASCILPRMQYQRPDPIPTDSARRRRAREQRQAADLEALRILAWCVSRGRYAGEPIRVEGGWAGPDPTEHHRRAWL